MGIDLPMLWMIIIAFGLMMYVVMDGFDLGIGLLFPFIPEKRYRDTMVNSVAPVWDANETWLVLGGAGLLAAFPLAYAVILSALYLPIVLMLAGLIWRGVAFEFRFKASDAHKPFWDKAFAWGSYFAAYFQGVSLGAYISGFPIHDQRYSGGALDWLTPFSLFTGLGVVAAYALLGSTWLIMKTDGELQRRILRLSRPIAVAVLIAIGGVSLWTPLEHPSIAARWFTLPNILFFAPVPLLVLATAWQLLKVLRASPHASPFVLALVLIFLGYSGLLISLWPNLVPPDLSFRAAAGPPQSLGFALVGALFVIPIILIYTAWSYYVFRGKVKVGEGYHS